MKKYTYLLGIASLLFSLGACSSSDDKADGYGNFEATEITISAENSGKILQFDLEEGDHLKQNQWIGYIDTISLSLKREQILASQTIIRSKSQSVLSQNEVLKAQLQTATTHQNRIKKLMLDQAATQKQLDDVQGEIAVLKSRIHNIQVENSTVLNELKSLDVQLKQIEEQIQKSKIINPINGTVLTKYVEPNEVTLFGKPLYKIADLNTLALRVYMSEPQLANIQLGQKVTVKIDAADALKTYKGTITWIASEAEFTPKIIQTKEERVALVYAVKILVKNDGSLKIGMPAEMWLNN